MTFHDVRFPPRLALGSVGGPERKTDVVALGTGAEERNARWSNSRRSWNIGAAARSLDDLHAIIAFFEERNGRLHGFRFRDPTDCKSCAPLATPTATDQLLGLGTGSRATYPLRKAYGSGSQPWHRTVTKPVAGSLRVAVGGVLQTLATQYTVDASTGVVTFQSGHIPPAGTPVTAGFEFDVPVRFDTDKLEIELAGPRHGAIPHIPIVEIRS